MKLEEVEREALYLSPKDRATLAHKLLISLDTPSESEIHEEWLKIAQQRAKELDGGKLKPISAQEVHLKALSLVQ